MNCKLLSHLIIPQDCKSCGAGTTSGLECSDGVYFYVIQYTDKSSELKKLKGNVTLIR